MTAAVELENVTKNFGGNCVIEHFSLHIEQGEMTALMGPSGCGKTTLLNMIGLIEPATSGTITIFGKTAPAPNSREATRLIRNEISYLFQNFALVDSLTVQENLKMALAYDKSKKAEKLKKIRQALKAVGMAGFENRPVYTLSGGQQQRIALARTMLKKGNLILADEPTGALDSKNRDEVLTLLKRLNKAGKTIIIVTHDPVVASACHKTIELI